MFNLKFIFNNTTVKFYIYDPLPLIYIMSNKIEDFYLVYDFKGGDDYIPNCLNHDTTDIIFEQGGRVNGIVMEHYFKNYVQIPVMVENLNVHWDIFEKTTINKLDNKKINQDVCK